MSDKRALRLADHACNQPSVHHLKLEELRRTEKSLGKNYFLGITTSC